jgi:hypothetical protein
MNPKSQFENLEIMSRERATLGKKDRNIWLVAPENIHASRFQAVEW